MTRHVLYDRRIHTVTVLEASEIAGGSSGKAGGLLSDQATPKCLASLSFKTHASLAEKHDGDKLWGYRLFHCADVDLRGQDLDEQDGATNGVRTGPAGKVVNVPSQLDWLLPGAIQKYKGTGSPNHSAQVNPYMFTTSMAELAVECGAKIVIGSANCY